MNLSRHGRAALAVAAIALTATVVVNRETMPPPVERPTAAAIPTDTDGQPDAAWVSATSKSTVIGRRALAAYARAALRLDAEKPECRFAWNTLAAIAKTESNHGTFVGAAVDDDGVARPPVHHRLTARRLDWAARHSRHRRQRARRRHDVGPSGRPVPIHPFDVETLGHRW